jgi:hypothetical protein
VPFKTYLRTPRPAAGSLGSWEEQTNLEVRRHHVTYVVCLLTLSMMWGHVALWHMGQSAKKAERDFWLQIHAVAIAVLGLDEFLKMIDDHPERAALFDFFGGRLPSPDPVASPRLIENQ